MKETPLVVPKFSSRETGEELVSVLAASQLTLASLKAEGSLPLESSALPSRAHGAYHPRWWLEPCGGIHQITVTNYDDPRWLRHLLLGGWPCFVVWQGGVEGQDCAPCRQAPLQFAAYSRLPDFKPNGAQKGFRWLSISGSLWLAGEKWPQLQYTATYEDQQLQQHDRFSHSLTGSDTDFLLGLARQRFNEYCSDELDDAKDNWRLGFLAQEQRYRQDTKFAAWCQSVTWQQAFGAANEPWQLAIAIREHAVQLKAEAKALVVPGAQAAARRCGEESRKLLEWIDEYVVHFSGFPLI